MKFFNVRRSISLGRTAEKLAKRYLKRHGLIFVTSNYHSRFGEIDLVMRDSDTWVFVEVRCRALGAPVDALQSINNQKMKKIRKTAACFMMAFEEMPDCRFDVIAMTHNRTLNDYTINWVKNAF